MSTQYQWKACFVQPNGNECEIPMTKRMNAMHNTTEEMLAMLKQTHSIIQSRFAGTHSLEDRIGLALMNDLRIVIDKAEGKIKP